MYIALSVTDEDTESKTADEYEAVARAALRMAFESGDLTMGFIGGGYATLALQARMAEMNTEGLAVHDGT